MGFRFTGGCREGATATDLVLTVTQMLRKHGVVGKFVEYAGPGLCQLSVADRATLANMSPEYGATAGFFPVDAATLDYLRMTGRRARPHRARGAIHRASRGCSATIETPDAATSRRVLELDLSTVEPSLAGPRRPQDRVALGGVREQLPRRLSTEVLGRRTGRRSGGEPRSRNGPRRPPCRSRRRGQRVNRQRRGGDRRHHRCTNTSNPSVMIGAGLLAKKAVERGLTCKPYVKTSLAPGLARGDRLSHAPACCRTSRRCASTWSATAAPPASATAGRCRRRSREAIAENDLVVCGRAQRQPQLRGAHPPEVRATYLASPPLVVAYALAGTVDIDLDTEPLGTDPTGSRSTWASIWPTTEEIAETIAAAVTPEHFARAVRAGLHW